MLELLSCNCKTSCKTKRCAFLSNGFLCTNVCKCDSYDNKIDDIDQDISAEEWDEETYNDDQYVDDFDQEDIEPL